jgi:GNAT superfamily N-acetyltransferase
MSSRVVPVKWSEHLFFNLCDFDFFRKRTGGNYLFFGNLRLLAPIVAVPYILSCEIIFFSARVESLYIDSLAVAPEYRRSGLGMFIVDFAAKL